MLPGYGIIKVYENKIGKVRNMFTTRELQDEILRLKKENDICILAHAYQSQDILEVADYVGDSYGLSLEAAKAAEHNTDVRCTFYGGNGKAPFAG